MSCLESSNEARKQLHWLPVSAHIEFKVLLIVFKWLKGCTPKYLKDLLCLNVRTGLSKNIRSNDNDNSLLIIPYVKYQTFAVRSFSVQGPKWVEPITS